MDTTTSYMGMKLKHPIVASSSPFSRSLDGIKSLAEAGAAAIVMHSLFEEQIEQETRLFEHYLDTGAHAHAEAMNYFPDVGDYSLRPDEYVELIRKAKASVDVPIIGSLNGVSTGGWVDYARNIEQAGADALEINMYFVPTDLNMRGDEVEQRYVDILCDVMGTVKIPVAMKLSPFFSSPANVSQRLSACGARGLVLFNRFYQPDLDIETLDVVPRLNLSESNEMRLPLRWIAILHGRINADLALSTGVHTHADVLKGLMAGARITMMASALLQHGVSVIGKVLLDLRDWMEAHEYDSVWQMQGSMSQLRVTNPEAFVRANYLKVLGSWHGPLQRENARFARVDDGNAIDLVA